MEANIWTTLFSGAIGAIIGTYGGSFFLAKRQENKIIRVRDIAIKGLKIIKQYAKTENTFDKATEEFNNKLNIAEKRAILVALHKLGVPIEIPKNDVFDIKNIKFGCKIIDIKEVEDMILQIAKGHCDHLFFAEVDSYFTANLRLNSIRGIAKKFVNEVLVKSEYDNEKMMVTYPKDWFNNFTYGEKLNIGVFKEMIAASEYFDDKGHTIPEKFVRLNKEIELGLWDIYLSWDYNTYSNIISQNKVNNALIQQFMGTNINSSQHEISESK